MTRLLGAMMALNVALFALGIGGQMARFAPQPPPRLAMPPLPADIPRLELLSARPAPPARPFVPIPPTLPQAQPEASVAGVPAAAQTLVPEVISVPQPAADRPPAGISSQPARQCFRAGPLPAAETAPLAALEKALKQAGAEAATQVPVPDRNVRHWVYVGAGLDAEAANAQAARLRAAGYRDVLALKQDAAWTVSMGLFDRAERAQALAERAQAGGFDARVQSRSSAPPRVWMQFRATAAVTEALSKDVLRGQAIKACPR